MKACAGEAETAAPASNLIEESPQLITGQDSGAVHRTDSRCPVEPDSKAALSELAAPARAPPSRNPEL
jgi:hypothetical protein